MLVRITNLAAGRWWALAGGGLLMAAVAAAGFGLKVHAAPLPKEEPAKEEPKKDKPKKAPRRVPQMPGFVFPDIEGIFGPLQPGGINPGQMDDLRKQLEEMRRQNQKALEELARAIQQANQNPGIRIAPFRNGGRSGLLNRNGVTHEGRLGAMVEAPTPTLIDQLDLPKDQGLIVNDVLPDSAAAKAGLKPHDILLELNGKTVPSRPEEFTKQLNDVKANTPVDAVVLRKGKKETVKGLALPEEPKPASSPGRRPRGAGVLPIIPGNILPRIGGPGLPGLPGLPGVPGIGLRGGFNATAMTVTRTNDKVTAKFQEGTVKVTVTGAVEDGKTKISEIVLNDAGTATRFDSVDKVPEAYRATVDHLIKVVEKNRGDTGIR